MSTYLLKQPTKKKTPQSQQIPGREKDMTRNNAGGFAFKADSFTRLERFLILGSESGSYYVGQDDLTQQNVDNVRSCIAEDGLRAVNMIVDISKSGRAPKNDPAIYALALAASCSNEKTRSYALDALPKVCRIGTHLFHFAAFVDSMRGWGPALRKAVAAWYLDKPLDKLAFGVCKYQQRDGWSHKDLIKLAHPNADLKLGHSALFRYIVKGEKSFDMPTIIQAMEQAKQYADNPTAVAALIRDAGLTREMVPTETLKSPIVWDALLDKMLPGAMIRTLGRMGAAGLLTQFSEASKKVVSTLQNRELLRAQRVHPIQVLAAVLTYRQGHGTKGSLTWPVIPQVVDALDDAFYASFEFVEPTNKRFYLGVDVSGSMTMGSVAGLEGLTPNMGAAAMAMLIARTEPNYFIGGFSTSFVNLGITKNDKLNTAMLKARTNFGGTDTSVAINHALKNNVPVDAFVIITDGETWAGDTHTSQSLALYRNKTGINSKLIVMNMVPNATRITDPCDEGSLDVVGFDASVPSVISSFLGGASNVSAADQE